MSLTSRTKDLPVDVLYRTSHTGPLVSKADGPESVNTDGDDYRQNSLQRKWANVKELEHGISFTEETRKE